MSCNPSSPACRQNVQVKMLRIGFISLLLALISPVTHANPSALGPIDEYIKTKLPPPEDDIFKQLTALDDKITTILDNYQNLDRYYRNTVNAAESELRMIKDKNPYASELWKSSMRDQVKKFCCDIQVNKDHRTKVVKWLEDWLAGNASD